MAGFLAWWAVQVLVGVLALPYVMYVFRRLPDRGLAFAKTTGALLLGYFLWLLGTLRLAPNGRGAAVLALVLLALGALLLWNRQGPRLVSLVKREWRALLCCEAIFLIALAAWSVVRSFNPDIEGTEKPMDFALLNTAIRSEFFPPADPWLSGHSVSYYYFGYVMMAAATHLSGQPPAVAYNLGVATLFASTAVGAWGLGMNLARLHSRARRGRGNRPSSRPRLWSMTLCGGLAALFMVFIGNMEGTLELLRWHGAGSQGFWSWVAVKTDTDAATGRWRLLGPAADPGGPTDSWYPLESWWWWRATRVIDTVTDGESKDYTITEFPFFSFLLGDLHPHVLALPVGLLGLGLCLELILARPRNFSRWLRAWPGALLPPVIVFGSLGFINGWDLIPYLSLYVGIGLLLLVTWRRLWDTREQSTAIRQPRMPLRRLAWFAVWSLLLAAGAFLIFAPFYAPLSLQLFSAFGPSDVAQGFPLQWWSGPGTRPVHFLLLWAPFALSAAALLIAVAPRIALIALCGLVVAWLAIEAAHGFAPATPCARVWPLLVVVPTLWLAAQQLRQTGPSPSSVGFALVLVAMAFGLFAASESFYLRDVFGNRMNTVFKLSYQAWTFLAVASAFAVCYLGSCRRAQVFLLGIALLVCLYPIAALPSKTNGLQGEPTLDGLAYARTRDVAEVQAIDWLIANVPSRGSVVLEATGGQYSQYGRVSSATGVPTVLGWAGHEVQWRGNDRLLRGRTEDVDRIYLAMDKAEVKPLLEKYGVTHVYVGRLERAKYPEPPLKAFSGGMDVAFQNDGVSIYKVRS